MNIRARIFARKITLIYFYEKYFVNEAGSKKYMLDEAERVSKIVDPHPEEERGESEVDVQNVAENYYGNVDEEIAYIIKNHFSKVETKDIDFQYIDVIAPHFNKYIGAVEEAVNTYTTTFDFASMDMMDRVIFTLGYIECDILNTPKEVLINEMIELAKRYGDDASPKLLNGIGHKVLTDLEQKNGKSNSSKEEDSTAGDNKDEK